VKYLYRPTVRYDDVYKDYVDELFHATHLDRNQILRAALFSAPFSDEFKALIENYRKKDVPLPDPKWSLIHGEYWLEQCPKAKREEVEEKINNMKGRDVNADSISGGQKKVKVAHGSAKRGSGDSGTRTGRERTEQRRVREVHSRGGLSSGGTGRISISFD
jgi:hypothetical protein